jgi:hypothetical protein
VEGEGTLRVQDFLEKSVHEDTDVNGSGTIVGMGSGMATAGVQDFPRGAFGTMPAPGIPSADQESCTGKLKESQLHWQTEAIKNYCEDNAIADVKTVTIEMLEQTREGIHHWALLRTDCGQHTAPVQRFRRALEHDQQLKDDYLVLLPEDSKKFRQAFLVEENWDFTKKSKVKDNILQHRKTDEGHWWTLIQIAKHLGGAEHPESMRQDCRPVTSLSVKWAPSGKEFRCFFGRGLWRSGRTGSSTECHAVVVVRSSC